MAAFRWTRRRLAVVSEAGVCTALRKSPARNLDIDVARRGDRSTVTESMAELVKIEPQSIGVGLINTTSKRRSWDALTATVESAVATVGANLYVVAVPSVPHTGSRKIARREDCWASSRHGRFRSAGENIAGVGANVRTNRRFPSRCGRRRRARAHVRASGNYPIAKKLLKMLERDVAEVVDLRRATTRARRWRRSDVQAKLRAIETTTASSLHAPLVSDATLSRSKHRQRTLRPGGDVRAEPPNKTSSARTPPSRPPPRRHRLQRSRPKRRPLRRFPRPRRRSRRSSPRHRHAASQPRRPSRRSPALFASARPWRFASSIFIVSASPFGFRDPCIIRYSFRRFTRFTRPLVPAPLWRKYRRRILCPGPIARSRVIARLARFHGEGASPFEGK